MDRRHVLKALAAVWRFARIARPQDSPRTHIGATKGTAGPTSGPSSTPPTGSAGSAPSSRRSISRDTVKARLPPLKMAWGKRADTIVNNGHTIQVNFTDAGMLNGPGGDFKLIQFHFHHPSEHLIGGKSFPMEAHFVHANPAGALAVVGVLMATGKPNAVFSKIVSTMPDKEGPPVRVDAAIDPNGLLPKKRSYYRYSGSLTTPPCSETVDWLLLTDPIEVAEADVARFAKLYPLNARPAQKSNRRFVLLSS